MKYMLLMMASKKSWGSFDTMKPEDIRAHVAFMQGINAELAASKELVDAQGLTPEAIIVQAKAGGAPVVSDGPFPETKELLAGFWILDLKSRERAVEIAAKISTAPGAGGKPMNFPVEVRPVGTAPEV